MAEDVGADRLAIRTMSAADVERTLEWAAEEGWNPGLEDAACFRVADRDGFLVGCIDGRAVASISVVRYSASFGFLGCYIVRPEWRGRGLGLRLWQAGLAHLDGCTIGLDGVVAQQGAYRRSGFDLHSRNLRFAGEPPRGHAGDARLRRIDETLFPMIAAYDARYFPAPREAFLRCWLWSEGHVALALVEGAELRGYGVVRGCREGCKIGPLFAEHPEAADTLFRALAVEGGRAPAILDVPEPNRPALALAERPGMRVSFETARMYRGPAPDIPLNGVYGVTSFELG
jgi:predicted N-acetyltransferase YhbS